MEETLIGLLIAALFALAGWGWQMSPRWVHLTCRALSIDSALAIPVVLGADWIGEHGEWVACIILPFIVAPIVVFWEKIPIPVLHKFKANSMITFTMEKNVKPSALHWRRDMKDEPESFIFPYLQTVSTSLTKNKKNPLCVRFCCPSALPYDLELNEISVHFTINGHPVKNQPIFEGTSNPQRPKEGKRECITIFRQRPNENSIYIFLNRQMRAMVSEYARQVKPVEVWLTLTGYDKKRKRHILSTKPEPWATIIHKQQGCSNDEI